MLKPPKKRPLGCIDRSGPRVNRPPVKRKFFTAKFARWHQRKIYPLVN